MGDIKKRGLDSLISQNTHSDSEQEKNEGGYTKTVGFKVSERQYEIYKLYSKYYSQGDLIDKWRQDLEKIAQENGEELRNLEIEIRKRLTK